MKKTISKIHIHGRFRSHVTPILVWLTTVLCVVVLFYNRTQQFEVLGIARGQVCEISATCTGRIESLPVELFDKVRQGDTIAVINTVLDNENLHAELALISAEIQKLQAELILSQEQFTLEASARQTDILTTQRRFAIDIENTRLRILEFKTLIETDRITLQDLELEVKIAQDLLNKGAIANYEFQKAQVLHNTLAKTVEANGNLLTQASRDLEQAQYRYSQIAAQQPQQPSVDNALNVIRKAIAVQQHQIEQIMKRRQTLELKAPFDGIVSQIQDLSGETILAGDPIMTITEVKPTEIIAYANENQLGHVKEAMPVKLIKNSAPAQIASSQVVHIGPDVQLMPQRLWQNPTLAQWGRPILIKIPPDLRLIPGEIVGIRGL